MLLHLHIFMFTHEFYNALLSEQCSTQKSRNFDSIYKNLMLYSLASTNTIKKPWEAYFDNNWMLNCGYAPMNPTPSFLPKTRNT